MSGDICGHHSGDCEDCEDGAMDAALHLQCLGQPSTENDLASCQLGGETLVESFGSGWEARAESGGNAGECREGPGTDHSPAHSCTTRPRASALAPCGRAVQRPISRRASLRCTRTCGNTAYPQHPMALPCSREARAYSRMGAGGRQGGLPGQVFTPSTSPQERPPQAQCFHHGQVTPGL